MSSQSKSEKRDLDISTAVSEHGDRLMSAIRRQIRDQAEAQDVLQDVFEEYIEAYDLGVAIEKVGAWLVRVAQNKIIDRFRRRKTQNEYQALHHEEKMAKTTEDEFVRFVLGVEIVDALEMLPPEQLFVFVKHELEGKTFEEISEETGVSVNTLLSRKRYAINFLRKYLKEVYDELE